MTAMERAEMIMNDNAALAKMLDAETPDALMDAITAAGIDVQGVSKEEAFAAFQQAKNGEMGDAELDEVAGGFSLRASGSFLANIFNVNVSSQNGRPTVTAAKGLFGLAFDASLRIRKI